MRRRWETEGSSYVVVQAAVGLLKFLGVVVMIAALFVALAIATGDGPGNERVSGAIIAVVTGAVVGVLLMALGGALDIYLGIDASVQELVDIGRRDIPEDDPHWTTPEAPPARPLSERTGDWASGGDERGWY